MLKETILNVLPGETADQRVSVVHSHANDGSRILLRQESYSDDVGWFVQSSVELEASQIAGLKMSLGARTVNQKNAAQPKSNWTPSVIRFPETGIAG